MVVSPGAEVDARAWMESSSRLLDYRAVEAEGGLVQVSWREALGERRAEVAWVRPGEADNVEGAGLEIGETVEVPAGGLLVPVFRRESKWRGPMNAAAKWQRETAAVQR